MDKKQYVRTASTFLASARLKLAGKCFACLISLRFGLRALLIRLLANMWAGVDYVVVHESSGSSGRVSKVATLVFVT